MEATEITDERLLSRREACSLLQCKETTFWRYTKAGKVPHYRIGRRMLFKKSEILEAIKQPVQS